MELFNLQSRDKNRYTWVQEHVFQMTFIGSWQLTTLVTT